MGKFTHYLVTRFNVMAEGLGPEFISPAARTMNWEKDRLTLFQRYCAPTVNGQSSKNFTWLLFCDRHSDPILLDGIRQSMDPTVSYQIIQVSDFSDMMQALRVACTSAQSDYVITTRLDNDDGIAIDFISTIQSNFIPQHNSLINLLGGVHYQRDKGILTYLRYSANNSFISLIEERSTASFQSVLGFKHLTPGKDKTIRNVPMKFAFWMTLHEFNAAPRINLGWPVSTTIALKHYSIQPEHVVTSLFQTARYGITWFPGAVGRKISFLLRNKWQHLRHTRDKIINQTAR